MARVVLKHPSSPSLKKTMKPPSVHYKTLFYRMVLLNIIQAISIGYLINKPKADLFLLPLIEKIKRLL